MAMSSTLSSRSGERVRVVYTGPAKADLDRIRGYLRERNPAAATKLAALIRARIKLLKKQPRMGPAVAERPGARELVVQSYVLAYRVLDERIEILRVWHGAQDRTT